MSKVKGGRGFVFVLFIITLLVLAHLWQKLYITQLSQRIHSLEETRKRIEEKNKRLLIRWAQLSHPQRLEKIAQRWGFSYPRPKNVTFLISSSPQVGPGRKADRKNR